MLLVDSSVWIESEKRDVGLRDLSDQQELAVCPPVVYEVLRGATTQARYERARRALLLTKMLDAQVPLERFEQAANLYLRCHHAGYTVQGFDCLIAASAIANAAEILHRDGDYDVIAKVAPLRTRRI